MAEETFIPGKTYEVTFVDHYVDAGLAVDEVLSFGPCTITLAGLCLGENQWYWTFARDVTEMDGEPHEADVFYVIKGTVLDSKQLK